MPRLECLFIDGGTQLRGGGGQAAPAGSLLAAAHGSNNAHAAIGSVDSNLDRSLEELVVEAILDGEWLQGEGAPRRFGEEWRKVNGIEGRHQRRRFTLHELRLRRSASRGSGKNGDDGGGHKSVLRAVDFWRVPAPSSSSGDSSAALRNSRCVFLSFFFFF
jgi:hypothetical protein